MAKTEMKAMACSSGRVSDNSVTSERITHSSQIGDIAIDAVLIVLLRHFGSARSLGAGEVGVVADVESERGSAVIR